MGSLRYRTHLQHTYISNVCVSKVWDPAFPTPKVLLVPSRPVSTGLPFQLPLPSSTFPLFLWLWLQRSWFSLSLFLKTVLLKCFSPRQFHISVLWLEGRGPWPNLGVLTYPLMYFCCLVFPQSMDTFFIFIVFVHIVSASPSLSKTHTKLSALWRWGLACLILFPVPGKVSAVHSVVSACRLH